MVDLCSTVVKLTEFSHSAVTFPNLSSEITALKTLQETCEVTLGAKHTTLSHLAQLKLDKKSRKYVNTIQRLD